jgi:predicted DNA-binding protein (MmcQ/YjbR family)
MKTHKEIEQYLLTYPNAVLDYPFGEDVAVYRIGHDGEANGKMFALIQEKSNPVRLSLKCDPQLSTMLREKYESVLPGYHLNKKYWNTILCTGQVSDEDLKSLISVSYRLVNGDKILDKIK